MDNDVIAPFLEVGKYYKVPIVQNRITHIPTGEVMENEDDAMWHCVYKGYRGSDFKTEEISRTYFPFRVEAITAWGDDDEEIALQNDRAYRKDGIYDLEYELSLAFDEEMYVEADHLINAVEITSELEKISADENFKEYQSLLNMCPDEPEGV